MMYTGWWCNNHLEKYESQWEGLPSGKLNIDPENSLVLMETNLPTLSAKVYANLPEGIPYYYGK